MKTAALAVIAIGLWAWCGRGHDPGHRGTPLRFATFNIENFPKDARQITGAFDEIARLDAGFVAVQEISDPRLFLATARERLGPAWDFAHVDTRPQGDDAAPYASHHIGVLYDRDRYRLVSTASHDDTRVGRQKPTFEVLLRPRDEAPDLRVFVVHLKSGGDHRELRARQLRALAALLRRSRGEHPRDRTVVLGDFNATDDGDRSDIAAAARAAGMTWATEELACSAFWDRDDGCPSSRLDHVLTWAPPTAVAATGACATDGCAWHDRCPLYADHVSDHCPVVVTFAP